MGRKRKFVDVLFHLSSWPFQGLKEVESATLRDQEFVHLCTPLQLLATAGRHFSSLTELSILVLDRHQLQPFLQWEDLEERGEDFPHLYHPIPESSLLAVLRMGRDVTGAWVWPSLFDPFRSSPLGDGPDKGDAFIEPGVRFAPAYLPRLGILSFFPRTAEWLSQEPTVTALEGLGSAVGPGKIWVLSQGHESFAVCTPGFGGPLAATALEELIALGCREFVAVGGAGSLEAGTSKGQVVLVSAAVRDEGLSYHYLASGQTAPVNPVALQKVRQGLDELEVPYRMGLTWTTDALYRETPARIDRRQAQGCLTVEMEVASLLAVASYRGVPLVPLLMCGDDLSGECWDFRDWTCDHDSQEKLFWLGVRLGLSLGERDDEPGQL